MARVTVFIDNAWLFKNLPRLGKEYGSSEYQIDYAKLPRVLADIAGRQFGYGNLDLTRTFLFDGEPTNSDPLDTEALQKRKHFFEVLRQDHGYDVELSPIDYRGRRLRAADRDAGDWFQPRQCRVDMDLGTKMVSFSALPNACDVIVALLGDVDFVPALQRSRLGGQRVVIASIRGSCSSAIVRSAGPAIRDGEIIWLNDHLAALELKRERHQLECQSTLHTGDRKVWTNFYPRLNERFYCDQCRAGFRTRGDSTNQILLPRANDPAVSVAA